MKTKRTIQAEVTASIGAIIRGHLASGAEYLHECYETKREIDWAMRAAADLSDQLREKAERLMENERRYQEARKL